MARVDDGRLSAEVEDVDGRTTRTPFGGPYWTGDARARSGDVVALHDRSAFALPCGAVLATVTALARRVSEVGVGFSIFSVGHPARCCARPAAPPRAPRALPLPPSPPPRMQRDVAWFCDGPDGARLGYDVSHVLRWWPPCKGLQRGWRNRRGIGWACRRTGAVNSMHRLESACRLLELTTTDLRGGHRGACAWACASACALSPFVRSRGHWNVWQGGWPEIGRVYVPTELCTPAGPSSLR